MTTVRRPLTVTALAVAALACALPALAAWTATSSGASATAKASSVQPVTNVTTVATSSTVTVSWVAPTTGAPPSGYTVLRTAPTTATVCQNVASPATCPSDSGLTAGVTYSYSVLALRGNSWTSDPATATATTTAVVAPAGSDVQANSLAGGKAEKNDTVTFTYSQTMSPGSILSGWDGSAGRQVFVRIADGGLGNDTLAVFSDSAYTTQVGLGTVDLGRSDYVSATSTFGAASGGSGNFSTMAQSGASITVTLGQQQTGTVTTAALAGVMVWTPSASATNASGTACSTTPVLETGTPDKEF